MARDGRGLVAAMLVAAALLFAAYLHVTPYNTRSNDVGAHLKYIGLVEQTRAAPRPGDCWECHQPPGYYALAAAALGLSGVGAPPERGPRDAPGAATLQALAAALGLATLACWLLTLRLVLRGRPERLMASALCTFWPALTLDTCKIGNDGLEALMVSATIWQLVRWRRTRRPGALVAAAALAGLSPFAKTSGVVAAALVVASVAGAVVWPEGAGRRWPRGATAGALTLGALSGAWVAYVGLWMHGQLTPDFRSIGPKLLMQNTLSSLLTVNLTTFAHDPFAHAGGGAGRDEFWNYLFRSSLFGEFVSSRPATIHAADGLALLAAAMIPLLLVGFSRCALRGLGRDASGARELALAAAGLLGFLFAVRLQYPYAPHNDFRFVLPLVMPLAAMTATSLGRARRWLRARSRIAAALPALGVAAFCAASVRVLLFWP